MRRGKSSPLTRALLAVCVIILLGSSNLGGCNSCPFGGQCEDFRDAANPSIQTGVTAIMTGLINGVFALINTGADSASAGEPVTFSQGGDPNNP